MRVRIVRVVAIVSALLLGVAACGDDDGEASAVTTAPVGDATSDGDVSSADDAEEDRDESEMSDDDRERVARALVSTVGADSYEIDGETLVYIYEDGSSEDPGVDAHCMSMIAIQGAFELVILEFPDGSHECGIATLE